MGLHTHGQRKTRVSLGGVRGSLLPHFMIWGSHIQPEVVLNIVRNLPCHLEELEYAFLDNHGAGIIFGVPSNTYVNCLCFRLPILN
jgi:hypothetical protein